MISKFFVHALLLFSPLALAQGITHSQRYDEGTKFRYALSFGAGAHNVDSKAQILAKDTYGFGLHYLVGNILATRQAFVPGFEFIIGITVGGASYGKFLSESAAKQQLDGFMLDSQFGLRYLHTLADNFDLGGMFTVGYGAIFAPGVKIENFGLLYPLHFRIGPSGRLVFRENLDLYFSLLYNLSALGSTSSLAKHLENTIIGGTNKSGLELPIGFSWGINKHVGLFAEGNVALRDFQAKSLGLTTSIDAGLFFTF